ncbi:uncharacterized protein LOC130614599 [Hydractinia symbiolongicarpus]|uniref:uncharacterized protein LOC130614599 n=1 Tax=Hydractinia symbiolongicarpus TaxID=13093 RepID=UPI00254A4049|nr:uncharacterized protein LOC130614599 [Hydractinia symbiolongicarpus]XP_057292018.1 uncharacterized protein LOC130614599 [Hydractinia symbiolongicarpus]XP_057292019.1 uncharacterized protein LOC130614599 [Hydractinia symbiolongicarpus]
MESQFEFEKTDYDNKSETRQQNIEIPNYELLLAGFVGIGIAIGFTPLLMPYISTTILSIIVTMFGIVGFFYQYIKKTEKRQKERERIMQKRLQQEKEDRELAEKERIQKDENAAIDRKQKLEKDLKDCFDEVHDNLSICCKDIEKAKSNSSEFLDVGQMRLKLDLIKKDIDRALSNFSFAYRENRKVLSESLDVLKQLNIITSFHKEAECKKEELKVFKERLEEIKTNYGTTPFGRLARSIKKDAVLLEKKNNVEIYKLPVILIEKDSKNKLRLFELGLERSVKPMKYVMMAGMTGAGKSLLINNIINYVYGVTYRDNFRFQLIVEEEELQERGNASRSKAESMTSWVSSFVLHYQDGFRINYSFTIIDTPGFGDTRGINYDEMIIDQLRQFFDSEKVCPVKELSCIGLVIQASQARITEEQKYIFDQVLNIFGKDMTENIFLLFTFADAQPPPALEVVKDNKIPFNENATFKFNNSALHASNNDVASDHSWVFGYDSLKKFFNYLNMVTSTSLNLTKEVLKERDGLKSLLESLQNQIDRGMDMLQSIENMTNDILTLKGTMKANKDYKIKSKRYPQTTEVVNHHITNCKACMFTCHNPCHIPKDKKKKCSSMRDGKCVVCPGKCPWDSHSNGHRIYIYREIEVENTVEDMMNRYQIAMTDKDGKKKLLLGMLDEYRVYRQNVSDDIHSASCAAKSLEEIALRQSFLTNVTYIERLIKSEEASSRPNKKIRLEQLHHFKNMAETLQHARADPTSLTENVSNYEATVVNAIKNIDDEIKNGGSYFKSNQTSSRRSERKRKCVNLVEKSTLQSKGGILGYVAKSLSSLHRT